MAEGRSPFRKRYRPDVSSARHLVGNQAHGGARNRRFGHHPASSGRQVAITSVGSRRVEFDLVDFYRNRLRLVGVDTTKLTGRDIAQIMDELRAGFEGEHLRPPVVRTWPLELAVEAYSAVADGDASAKHVLIPSH